MKKLLATAAISIFAATNAHAADPYANQYYGMQQAQPQQLGQNPYAPAQYAANPYQQNNQAAAYNNYQPAAGNQGSMTNPDKSRWPFWYVGLNAGAVSTTSDDWERGAASGDLDLDSSVGYSATIGYQPSNLRYEAELGYAKQDVGAAGSNGEVKAMKLMGNAIYDFAPTSGFTPFLGAGLGVVQVDIKPTNPAAASGDDNALAYQLIGGVNFVEVLPQTDLSLAYKYLGTFSDLKEDGAEFEYDAHAIEAGARFRF